MSQPRPRTIPIILMRPAWPKFQHACGIHGCAYCADVTKRQKGAKS